MSFARIPFWQVATAAILIVFVLTGGWYYYQASTRIIWSMIHLNGESGETGNAHLLELPNGDIVLIGAGFDGVARSDVIPYLEERGVERINQLVVTAAGRYDYPGIAALLRWPGNIHRLYLNIPSDDECRESDPPTICSSTDRAPLVRMIETSDTSLAPFRTDDVLYHDEEHDIILEAVYVHEYERIADTRTKPPASGTLLRLIYGTTTVLFTGDLNRAVGDHLVDEHYFLESAIMTAPDYRPGSDAASATFLDTVNARVIMVSDSAERWHDTGSEGMRQFAFEHDVPAYVTGLHGNVVVTLRRDGYTVDTERAAPSD